MQSHWTELQPDIRTLLGHVRLQLHAGSTLAMLDELDVAQQFPAWATSKNSATSH